jgi:Icc-related predicted phosphoesterase
MKVLAFSDIHGHKKFVDLLKEQAKKHQVELAICAGDFSLFGRFATHVLADLQQIGIPILLIHGNHEDHLNMQQLCKPYSHIVLIHKDVYDYKGFTFIGYGGLGFSTHCEDFRKWSKIHLKKNHTVLITHQPAYATKLDEVDKRSTGNKDFTEFILKAKPRFAISGHIHEHMSKQDKLGSTTLVNPGPFGCILTLEQENVQLEFIQEQPSPK